MEVRILVDGEKVPVNEFVQGLIGQGLAAQVEELHGVPEDWDRIEVTVER